jgi:hypothetical protein
MILKIFLQKNSAKKLAFFTQNKAKLCKILIITLVFEKNANFVAENWEKPQKIVIITSTPGNFPSEMENRKNGHLVRLKPVDPLARDDWIRTVVRNFEDVELQAVQRQVVAQDVAKCPLSKGLQGSAAKSNILGPI